MSGNTMSFTIGDLEKGLCSHEEFYAQPVTDEIIDRVVLAIGENAIISSKMPLFEDTTTMDQWYDLIGGMSTLDSDASSLLVDEGNPWGIEKVGAHQILVAMAAARAFRNESK